MPEDAEATVFDSRVATPTETASYIADLAGELSTLARRADHSLLAYLLDVAVLEAKGLAGKSA